MGRRLDFYSLEDLTWWVERKLNDLLLNKHPRDNLALSSIDLALSCKSVLEFESNLVKRLNFPAVHNTAIFVGVVFDIVYQNRRVCSSLTKPIGNTRLYVGRCFKCGLDGHLARHFTAGEWRNKCHRSSPAEYPSRFIRNVAVSSDFTAAEVQKAAQQFNGYISRYLCDLLYLYLLI